MLILLGILNALKIWSGMTPFLVVIVVSTIYLLLRAQKYDHNLFDEKGKLKKGAGKQLMVPAIIGITILNGASEEETREIFEAVERRMHR
ncbi:MAG: hypothetical protein SCK57_05810 [Bacillota bacterium]|nr:hypothetical protein [Bacillota bacterium]MDW7677158.1 hypothetical protein [Bacillota bacterium]